MAAPQTMNAAAFAGKLRQDDLSMSPPRAESPLRYSDRSPQGASGERTLLVEADSYFGTDERPAARAESPAASRGNTRATAPAAPGAAVDQPGSAGGSDNRRSSGLAAVRTRPTTPSRSSSPMSSFTAKGTQKGVIWSGTVSPSRWAGNLRAQDDVVAQVRNFFAVELFLGPSPNFYVAGRLQVCTILYSWAIFKSNRKQSTWSL